MCRRFNFFVPTIFLSQYFLNLTFRRNQASEKWGNVCKVKWQSQDLNPALSSCKNCTYLILYHLYEYSQVLDEHVHSCQALCLQPAKWVRAPASRLVVVTQSGGALGDWGAWNPGYHQPWSPRSHLQNPVITSTPICQATGIPGTTGETSHALSVILTEIP